MRLLPIRSQFLVSGNIRDVFITPTEVGEVLMPLIGCLWMRLRKAGFEFLVIYDRVDGVQVFPADASIEERASKLLKLEFKNGFAPTRFESLVDVLRQVVSLEEARIGAVIAFGSRIAASPQALDAAEQRFFSAVEKLSLNATPLAQRPNLEPLHNPVIWLLNRAQDVPSWFAIDNQRTATLVVPRPDTQARLKAAGLLLPLFRGATQATEEQRNSFQATFADDTDGMSLQSLADIAQLAYRQGLASSQIEDAIRGFKLGVFDDPWRRDTLRAKMRGAPEVIEDRVKGQRQAAVKTVDILTRSVMGLSGAHAPKATGRPRGVLLFAGPTGVGKTELAKTLTQILFGDERAYIRFDMSEFSEEQASARLLGAPSGYIGYDAGGELTNAVRQRPFRVILFDEIEKTHPRLLDKILQILEDGRLTDGRGDTVYFSESVLIFTSNLGTYVEDDKGRRVQNVSASDSYETFEKKIRGAIGEYFTYRLGRPELLNRIGDNFVVFNFISNKVAQQILDGMLANVIRRIWEEHKVSVELSDKAILTLRRLCTEDLSNGGRGIGNMLESVFVNPLGRALFTSEIPKGTYRIDDVVERQKVYTLIAS